jgi:hypothetical protein
MNADPVVMEFFPRLLSRKESDDFAVRIGNKLEQISSLASSGSMCLKLFPPRQKVTGGRGM